MEVKKEVAPIVASNKTKAKTTAAYTDLMRGQGGDAAIGAMQVQVRGVGCGCGVGGFGEGGGQHPAACTDLMRGEGGDAAMGAFRCR